MGSIGIEKMLLIGLFLLIFFGPSKLPELGKALGKGIQEFKKASRELQDAVNAPAASTEGATPKAKEGETGQGLPPVG